MKRISSVATSTASALAALLVFQLCVASGARAAMQVVVGNPGLQHFDSDGGVELDFGLTDRNGQPVGNLRPDNLQVFEDGKLAKILDFRGVGQGRPVDIVFVMDVTESMQPYIDAIKQNMVEFRARPRRQQSRLPPWPGDVRGLRGLEIPGLQLRLSEDHDLGRATSSSTGSARCTPRAAAIFPRISSTRSPTRRAFRFGRRRKASSSSSPTLRRIIRATARPTPSTTRPSGIITTTRART